MKKQFLSILTCFLLATPSVHATFLRLFGNTISCSSRIIKFLSRNDEWISRNLIPTSWRLSEENLKPFYAAKKIENIEKPVIIFKSTKLPLWVAGGTRNFPRISLIAINGREYYDFEPRHDILYTLFHELTHVKNNDGLSRQIWNIFGEDRIAELRAEKGAAKIMMKMGYYEELKGLLDDTLSNISGSHDLDGYPCGPLYPTHGERIYMFYTALKSKDQHHKFEQHPLIKPALEKAIKAQAQTREYCYEAAHSYYSSFHWTLQSRKPDSKGRIFKSEVIRQGSNEKPAIRISIEKLIGQNDDALWHVMHQVTVPIIEPYSIDTEEHYIIRVKQQILDEINKLNDRLLQEDNKNFHSDQ